MTDFAEFLLANGYTRVAPTREAELEWVEHVAAMNDKVIMSKSKSWFTGHNTNLDRDDRPRLMIYTGGALRYRRRLNQEAADGYSSFRFEKSRVGADLQS
jgi:hypothetical protein